MLLCRKFGELIVLLPQHRLVLAELNLSAIANHERCRQRGNRYGAEQNDFEVRHVDSVRDGLMQKNPPMRRTIRE